MRSLFLLTLLLGACVTDDPVEQGTSVGNPSLVQLKTAAGGDISLATGRAMVDAMVLQGLDGTARRVPVGRELDLLAGGSFEVPPGMWRQVILVFDPPLLTYRGETTDGFDADIELRVPDVRLQPEFDRESVDVEGTPLVLELGFPGWLGSDFFPFTRGADVRIRPGMLLHDRLVAAIRDRSALFPDDDRDGRLSEAERRRRQALGRDRDTPPPSDTGDTDP